MRPFLRGKGAFADFDSKKSFLICGIGKGAQKTAGKFSTETESLQEIFILFSVEYAIIEVGGMTACYCD